MAHNINFNQASNQYSFVSAKELPWHKLGQLVDQKMTVEEAIIHSHLDYIVEKKQAYTIINDEYVEIPNSFATYRTDTNDILTRTGKTVSKSYNVIQNKEAFEFFNYILDKNEAIIETAGALGFGEIVFMTAKLPETYITPNDVLDNYLFLTMSHDGTLSIQAAYTPVRIVCNNTLSLALSNSKHKISIRHTKNASEMIKIAQNLMNIAISSIDIAKDVYQKMSKTYITDIQKKDYFNSIFLTYDEIKQLNDSSFKLSTRKNNILKSVLEYSEIGIGQDMVETRGTVWGAYNAITGYMQNVKSYKNDNLKMNSLLNGDYKMKIDKAFNQAIKLI